MTDRSQCEEIETKYQWVLIDIEQTNTRDLHWDCIFNGYCQFPPGGLDWSQGDAIKTDRELEDE